MLIRCDCPGSERSHGYTDDGEWVWYWLVDHTDGTLSFRDAGTPVDQPEEPPAEVVEVTEEWVDDNLRGYTGGEQA